MEPMLFDFTSASTFNQADVDNWREVSDTVRTPGMSKAVFSLQLSRVFQRAVMFAMINPQPNGAGFAGMITAMPMQAVPKDTKGFRLRVRSQGELVYWKVVLSQKSVQYDYEIKFKLQNMKDKKFEDVLLPFSDFEALFRGGLVPEAPPLDLTLVDSFGFQTFGGVYDTFKQAGTGSLEIDYVALYD